MKAILVYVNGTAQDLAVLATSLQVGRLFNGHLCCLHVVPDRASLVGPAINVDLAAAMSLTDAIRALQIEAAKRVAHAREIFFAFCEDKHIPHTDNPQDSLSVSASWEERAGKPIDALLAEAHFHDLIVVEGGNRRDLILPQDDISRLVVSAGRPVLLVPPAMHSGSLKSIAIAWKDCPEAVRAVTAAMPLLAKAEKVIVIHANEEADSSASVAHNRFADYLRSHGINTEACHVSAEDARVADAVVGKATELGAGLLVMGSFGHNRLREFVFGGFTQRVLDGIGLPAFLFH